MSWDCLDALLESLLEPESSLVENKGGLLCVWTVCRCEGGLLWVLRHVHVCECVCLSQGCYFLPIETRWGEKNNHSFNRVNWKLQSNVIFSIFSFWCDARLKQQTDLLQIWLRIMLLPTIYSSLFDFQWFRVNNCYFALYNLGTSVKYFVDLQ